MTREEKIALCRKLKAAGLSVREIADQTSIPRATVHDYLVGREHVRNCRSARIAPCVNCGGPRFASSPVGDVCRACLNAEADAKARKVEALWREGQTRVEICAAMGWTYGRLGREMVRLRAKGYDLPYRYQVAEPKFPEQVAA